MSRHHLAALAFATSLAAAAQPASAAIEIGGSVFAQARGQLAGRAATADSQLRTFAVGIEPGPVHDLAASASVTQDLVVNESPNSLAASEQVAAHWASANSGDVTVPNREWTVNVGTTDDGLVQFNTPGSGRADWTYDFTATADGAFDVSFALATRGDQLGLGTWDFRFSDDSNPTQVTNLSTGFNHLNGSLSQALVAGHSYEVALFSDASADVARGPTPFAGSESDRFDWRITEDEGGGVPEPSAWALSILGFGLAGSALRRRREAVA